jgi:hypothetical protein
MDTSYILALYDKNDKYHAKANELKKSFNDSDKFVLSDAVILEIGNGLSEPKFRKDVISFITEIRSSTNFRIFPLSKRILQGGLNIFSSFQDKYWGLVDCISFFIMKEQNISNALTADSHFKQAGFIAQLLL